MIHVLILCVVWMLRGQGFLTANLQNHARKHRMPIDTVSCGYIMVDTPHNEILHKPEDGEGSNQQVPAWLWDGQAGHAGQECSYEPAV